MKRFKLYIIILLLIVLIISSIALVAWWNPFSWNIWQNIWNSIFYEQMSVECTKEKDCQDLHKNCYYSCSSNKCVQINTLVALKPYPDCSSVVSCTPKWTCDWGPCVNGAQSMTAVDSNNCGLSSAGVSIACPALARLCVTACKSDSDCASSQYVCQEIQGTGTVCSSTDSSCIPSHTIIQGECKLREGNKCASDADCISGLLCHLNICTNPQDGSCSGPNDTSCPAGYKCIQSCGPPVARVGDLPPPYFCELNEIANKPRNCPICLASNTNIFTPSGDINVKNIKVGTHVWSLNKKGEKISSTVIKISSTDVPKTHKVIHLVLSDKREVWASINHPVVNRLSISELNVGGLYDGSKVQSVEIIPYWDSKTYDILSDSETGYYWANGILLGSTLGP